MGWVNSQAGHTQLSAPPRWLCAGLLCLLVAACQQQNEPVVAGTALMQSVLQDVLGGETVPAVLIPPGSCPGHYDMRPSDIERVARCEALLLHPWQSDMPNVTSVIRASGIAPERVYVVPAQGNWMVPEAYADALEAVADVLAANGLDGGGAAVRAAERSAESRALGDTLQARLIAAGTPEVSVLCNDMIAPFAEWAGFSVAGVFGRSEDLSVGDVEALVRLGKISDVVLIIDNMQSGDEKMGAVLARETGAERVILSNFPGGLPSTGTWNLAVKRNAELILDALERVAQSAQ